MRIIMRALIVTSGLAIAMFVTGVAIAQQQQELTGTGQFCLKKAGSPAQCQWETMAQCEKARPAGSNDPCVDRTKDSTVGSGQDTIPMPGGSSPSNPVPE
jgi:hypothetical protein